MDAFPDVADPLREGSRAWRVLQISFLLFVALSVTQGSDDLFRVFFFLGMAPATLWLVFRERVLNGMISKGLGLVCVLLLSWIYLSVYWSQVQDLAHVAVRYTRWYLATLLFFLAAALYGRMGFHLQRIHGWVMQGTVIVAILVAMGLYFYHDQYPDRIKGVGLLSEVIRAASLLIMLWIISLLGLQLHSRIDAMLAISSLVLLTFYVFLSQSRAPLGVVGFVWLFLFIGLMRGIRWRLAVVTVMALLLSAVLLIVDFSPLVNAMLQRGGSFRLELWRITFAHLDEFKWIGIGVATWGADTPIGQDFAKLIGSMVGHPHNLFLTLWMYAGLPAFVLSVLMIGFAAWSATRLAGRERAIFLLAVIALVGLCFTSHSRVIASLQSLHLLIWMPIGMLCGAYARRARMDLPPPV